MGKIITCTVNKGGTGKTTLSVALACYAVKKGMKVALVDLDSQANATHQFVSSKESKNCLASSDLFEINNKGIDAKKVCFLSVKRGNIEPDNTIYDSLKSVNKYHFAIIPGNDLLLSVERLPTELVSIFVTNLKELANHFDLVVCDTPPTKGFGMLAPLMASDYAFSPINPDAFSADGVASLFSRVKAIKSKENRNLKFLGVVINRLNTHSPLQKKVSAHLEKQLGDMVISQVITERSAISNASFSRRPVWYKATSGSSRIAGKEMKKTMQLLLDKMNLKGVK
jgi:chromosome partitioning protein